MPWSSAARLGPRCSPGRRTLPATGARKGIPRTRFRSQSGLGTRLTTSETGPPIQPFAHPLTPVDENQLTPSFLFCTQHLDVPDARAISPLRKIIRMVDLVVAVLTNLPDDANTLFEVGVAVGLGKPVLLLLSNACDLPFNLEPFPHVRVSLHDEKAIQLH